MSRLVDAKKVAKIFCKNYRHETFLTDDDYVTILLWLTSDEFTRQPIDKLIIVCIICTIIVTYQQLTLYKESTGSISTTELAESLYPNGSKSLLKLFSFQPVKLIIYKPLRYHRIER